MSKISLLVVVVMLVLGWSSVAVADEVKYLDPVCTMAVTHETPYTMDFEGKKYYFCTEECKTAFSSEPAKYACFCLSGSNCPHCTGVSATCPCERMRHTVEHCYGKHRGY